MKYKKEFMEWRHSTKNPELCPDLLPDHVETDPEVLLAAKDAWTGCEKFLGARIDRAIERAKKFRTDPLAGSLYDYPRICVNIIIEILEGE